MDIARGPLIDGWAEDQLLQPRVEPNTEPGGSERWQRYQAVLRGHRIQCRTHGVVDDRAQALRQSSLMYQHRVF